MLPAQPSQALRSSLFSFLFLKIIVDLQCCANSAVQQSDPFIYIYIFFFSYHFPSCSIPRDWIEFPVLYSRISLLIHSTWNSLHLLTPNSLSIPLLPPSPEATTRLFSASVSLLLFCRQVPLCHVSDATFKWYHMVFVFLFQPSLSTRISSCIQVAADGIISFFFAAE